MALARSLGVALLLISGAAAAVPLWQEGVPASVPKSATLPDFTKIAQKSSLAVVAISTLQDAEDAGNPIKNLLDPHHSEQQKGLGAGFFIHPDGYLITNSHVVEGATEMKVAVIKKNGRTRDYQARIVGVDAGTDVALLKVDGGDETFPTLPLGDSDQLGLADWVAAIGNPYGLSHSITVGVVSFKGRTDVVPAGRDGYYDYIQTDASINPGNSGGPVINVRGEVVGIANAVNAVGQGIGFAIPINMAKAVLMPLLKDGRVHRSWLGITVEDLPSDAAKELGMQPDADGVLVSEVVEGGPGAKAGLKPGDIITAMDGVTLDDAQRMRWLAASTGVGKQVALGVLRGGKEEQLSAELGAMPDAEPATAIAQPTEVGLLVREVDVPTARSAGLALPMGAAVREVRPGSAAEQAGMRKGDVILKVDDSNITTAERVSKALSHLQGGGVARLVVRRGQETVFVGLRKP